MALIAYPSRRVTLCTIMYHDDGEHSRDRNTICQHVVYYFANVTYAQLGSLLTYISHFPHTRSFRVDLRFFVRKPSYSTFQIRVYLTYCQIRTYHISVSSLSCGILKLTLELISSKCATGRVYVVTLL